MMIPNPRAEQIIAPETIDSFEGIIVDIRTPEAYSEAHIPGAGNFCVYQVDFVQKFPAAHPDKTNPILVYGDGHPFKADLAALGRLEQLGYSNVSILEGGLRRWLTESRPVVGTGTPPVAEAVQQRFDLDVSKTKIRWVGRNLFNQHDGQVSPKTGFLLLDENGLPSDGKVVVDMQKMLCCDIEDTKLANMLIEHLASTDFFETSIYPVATYTLESAEPIAAANYGKPNYQIKGTLFVRGLSIDLELEALIEPVQDGCVFQTVFNFDRTELGALYGSGRIFERLGMHLVNDLVSIDVMAVFASTD